MSLLKKFLGLTSDGDSGDTETVRRIAGELERLPAEKARYLAGFAYVLARVAHADLDIDDAETAEMERITMRLAYRTESAICDPPKPRFRTGRSGKCWSTSHPRMLELPMNTIPSFGGGLSLSFASNA